MTRLLLLAYFFAPFLSQSQEVEFTWESMHQLYVEEIEELDYRREYEELVSNPSNSRGYTARRLHHAWVLGKLDDVYENLPKLFELHKAAGTRNLDRVVSRIFDFNDVPATEYRRNREMLKLVLKRFDNNADIQKELIPSLLFLQEATGEAEDGLIRSKAYLNDYKSESYTSQVRYLNLKFLNQLEMYGELAEEGMNWYQETNDASFLSWYAHAIHEKGDMVAFLLLEDTIRSKQLYYQYFDLIRLHIERGETEELAYYLDWFHDSVDVNSWSGEYNFNTNKGRYVFPGYLMKMIADYYRDSGSNMGCEIYTNILKSEKNFNNSWWKKREWAESFLAKVGTDKEEEAMESWERQRRYKTELKESCEFELNICEN